MLPFPTSASVSYPKASRRSGFPGIFLAVLPLPPPHLHSTVLGGCGKGKGSPYNDLCTLFTLDEFLGPRGFQNQRCTSFCCGLSKYSFLLLKRCRVPTGQGRRSADRRAQKPPERCWQPGVPLHHAPPGLVSRFFFCTPRQMTAMDEAATHTCVDCLLHYSLQKACKVWLGDGGERRNSPLAYKTVRPFRKTKAASVRPFWKDLFSQARGSHNKTDHWKITRGIPPAWAKQTCFCPDTCSSHGWNVGCSVPSGRCNHL